MRELRNPVRTRSGHFSRCWALPLLVALCATLAVGCVKREVETPNEKPLTERFEARVIETATKNFVNHHLEVGGLARCGDGQTQQQLTEAYLRVTRISSEQPAPVSKLIVEIAYDSGIFAGVRTNVSEENSALGELVERVSSTMNGGEICSCVRVRGYAKIIGRTIVVGKKICPPSKLPREKPLIRVKPSDPELEEPKQAL